MSLKSEPLDKANPVKGPQRYLQSEIMEFSFTPIPCNPNAIVLDKSSGNFKVGASKNLTLEEASDWDAEGAAESIFGAADFDSDTPDSTFARKGSFATTPVPRTSAPPTSFHLPRWSMESSSPAPMASRLRPPHSPS